MNLNISDSEQAEKYIQGELQQDEIEALWVKFLLDTELYNYFFTQVEVNHLIKEVNAGRMDWPFKI